MNRNELLAELKQTQAELRLAQEARHEGDEPTDELKRLFFRYRELRREFWRGV
jgi:hypothetical protein